MILDSEKLPEDNLELILQLVGNVPDLRSCEHSCRAVSTLIRTRDTVWSTCYPEEFAGDTRLPSHREKACVAWSLGQAKKLQNETKSAFLKAFGVDGWRDLINRIIAQPSFIVGDSSFARSGILALRGDALDSLLHIVEGYFDAEMEKANTLIVGKYAFMAKNGVDIYPVLATRCTTHDFVGLYSYLPELEFPIETHDDLLHWPKKDSAIRLIARRNGVVKMDNDVFDVVWRDVLRVIKGILRCAVTLYQHNVCLLENNADQVDTNRLLGERQTMYNTSPWPTTIIDEGDNRVLLHTIVSGQIEEAAKLTGFCKKLYGAGWLGSSKEEIDNAIAEAALQYEEAEEIDYMELEGEEAEHVEAKVKIEGGDFTAAQVQEIDLQERLAIAGLAARDEQMPDAEKPDEEMSDDEEYYPDEDEDEDEPYDEQSYDSETFGLGREDGNGPVLFYIQI